MVRTKRAQPGSPEKPTHEKVREMIPRNHRDSSKDVKLKQLQAKDTTHSCCKKFEEDWKGRFQQKPVVLGKPPRMEDFGGVDNFAQVINYQGWDNLFSNTICYPNLVRLFFCNLSIRTSHDGLLGAVSYVKGKELNFDASNINRIFGMEENDGFCISELEFMDHRRAEALKIEAYNYLFQNGQPSVNGLSLCARAVANVIVQYVQCREGKEMAESDYILTARVMSKTLVNFGDAFMYNLYLTRKNANRKLPYGALLTTIFAAYEVPVDGKVPKRITAYFGYLNLRHIQGRRIIAARGTEDNEDGSPLADGASGSNQEQVESEVLRKLDNLNQRHTNLRGSLKKMRKKFKKFRRSVNTKLDAILSSLHATQKSNEEASVYETGEKNGIPSHGS